MPELTDYDNEDDWMAACVPTRIDEGDEQDQAVAVCLSMWRERENKTMDNALKAISKTDDELRVGNYIVLFGGRDLEGLGSDSKNADGSIGEYFTPQTVLESSYTKAGALYVDWEHRQGELGNELLGVVDWKTAKVDDRGVFVERVLNRRNQYLRWLEGLIDQGLIGIIREQHLVVDLLWNLSSGCSAQREQEHRAQPEHHTRLGRHSSQPSPAEYGAREAGLTPGPKLNRGSRYHETVGRPMTT